MTHPTRDTTAGRAYLNLRSRARREGRPTDELLVLYVHERFLYRLSLSAHRDRLLLKGGMLLAAFDQRRPTRDIDLLARATGNDIDAVATLVRDVVTIEVDDGVEFDPTQLAGQTIREQDLYTAVRITMPAWVHRARHPLRIDVNVGDPVTPAPADIAYPTLLGDPFPLVGYPIETVLAEKIVTMIHRGDTTTRERDFADVVLLTRRDRIDANRLAKAITATARHRQTDKHPLREALTTLGSARQSAWERFAARSGLANELPRTYDEAIAYVAGFADPILTESITSGSWDPTHNRWQT